MAVFSTVSPETPDPRIDAPCPNTLEMSFPQCAKVRETPLEMMGVTGWRLSQAPSSGQRFGGFWALSAQCLSHIILSSISILMIFLLLKELLVIPLGRSGFRV